MMRGRFVWTSRITTTYPGVWKICNTSLYGGGSIGGPSCVQITHRSCNGRFSWLSKLSAALRSAARFCPSGVSGGILPSGGSVMSDVLRLDKVFIFGVVNQAALL